MPRCHTTWGQFAPRGTGPLSSADARAATRAKLETVLRKFGSLCHRPADLSPATIAAWIQTHPTRRPATVESYLHSLRAACAYATSSGARAESVCVCRSPRQWVDWDVEELPPPVHSAEEIAHMLRDGRRRSPWRLMASRQARAVVYAFAFTRAQRKELLGLAIADIDLVVGTIRIATNARTPLKTMCSAAQIPLAPPLAAVLKDWIALLATGHSPLATTPWLFPGVHRRQCMARGTGWQRRVDQVGGGFQLALVFPD